MEKQVATKQTTAVGTPLAAWGKQVLSTKSILIPRVLVMQPTSQLVTEGKAAFGDFISSLDEKKLVLPLSVIPVYMYEVWAVFKLVEVKNKVDREFIEMIQWNPTNDNWSRDFEENGQKFQRDRVMNLYCLFPDQIKSGGELPHLISFRSTSRNTGKKIYTQMYVANEAVGLSPAARCISISGEKRKADKGAWIQLESMIDRRTTQAEEEAALKWFKIIMAGQTKVDIEEIGKEVIHETKAKETTDVTDY